MVAVISGAFSMIERLALWLAYGALFVMMVLGTFDAVMRYGLSRPILGVDGLIEEAFMPMIVYLAASHVFSTGGHIRITVLSDHYPVALRRLLFACFDTLAACLMGLIAYGVGRRAIESYFANEYSTNPLGYLLAPSFAVVAVGSAVLMLRMVSVILSGRTVDGHAHLTDG